MVNSDLNDTVIYFLSGLALSIGYAGVSVYVFDFFEPAWGKGGSAQVVTWLFGAFGFLAALSFLLGHARFGHPMKLPAIMILSLTTMCVFAAVAFFTKSLAAAIVLGLVVGFLSGAAGTYLRWCRTSN